MDRQMKWAKKQRKYFDYETQNRRKMKLVKIMAVAAVVALVAFFRNEISGAVSSFVADSKIAKQKDATNKEPIAPSGEIRVRNKWQMPPELLEISGLSYIDAARFACVQDELGKIFIYNIRTSVIEKEIPFAAPGDYEGLAVVGESAWVLRADGTLFEVANFNSKPEVKKINTHLTAQQNAEGLCYDKNNNRLLVAIKDEEPGNPDYKGIYSFDLGDRKMPEAPVFKIDMKDKIFLHAGKTRKKDQVIKPSAIAIHPATGDIYVTDGPKAKLLVMNKSGRVEKLYQLNNRDFGQPEGITFSPGGELFISNEGSKSPGSIVSVEISN